MKYKLDFYTAYNQFYVQDKLSTGRTDSASFWTAEAYHDRLAMEEGIVGIGTECYGPIKGELEILQVANNEMDISQYDHIVEGGIFLESGTLQLLSCPNPDVALEIELTPGFYRIRVYSAGLATVNGEEGDDYYKIEIWAAQNMERKVLKAYDNP